MMERACDAVHESLGWTGEGFGRIVLSSMGGGSA